MFSTQISGDFAKLFEGGFEIFDDFLSDNVRIGKIVGFFEALVDVEADFVAVANKLLCSSCPERL